MRARPQLVIVVALAGCFDPRAQPGAPCDIAAPRCPAGQSCVAGECTAAHGDDTGMPDGTPTTNEDRDGDGVADVDDNCPDIANADQANEDGDRFGDDCDPCPIENSDSPTDPDGDGVTGACDPHPMIAGDKLVAFTSFASPLDSTWTVIGSVSFANGEATLATVAGNHSAVVPPIGPLVNATVMAEVIVDAQVGKNDSAASLAMPYDPQSDSGAFCELYAPDATTPNGRNLSLYDGPRGIERGTSNFGWATGVAYRLSYTRNNNRAQCAAIESNGVSHNTEAQFTVDVNTATAALAAYGANLRARWLLVVTSP